MHAEARAYVQQVVSGEKFGVVVEVGGRDINGGVRDLVDCDDYTSLDLVDGPGVDVVADCREWKPRRKADLVLCCEVLEHDPQPAEVVEACLSYLKKGGRLVITAAGPNREPHSTHDGGPLRGGEHYANINPDDLRDWLEELKDVEVEHATGPKDVYATGVKR